MLIPIVAVQAVPPAPPAATALIPAPAALLPGFHWGPWFGEQQREEWLEPGVRVMLNAPAILNPALPTRLIVYATPNGNTLEQTLGSALAEHGIEGTKTDWHFDIQHIAAQVRCLRDSSPNENIILACVEAEELSWPAWRQKHPDNAALIRGMIDTLRTQATVRGQSPPQVTLAAHSGGGSFLFGFLNGSDTIPDFVARIAFLDANYSYSDAERHGDKLLAWLKADKTRRLFVAAYDDRNIILDGKRVVGQTGGTFRATERMATHFEAAEPVTERRVGPFTERKNSNGQIRLLVHLNPDNKILHTALVGEMNGLLAALSDDNTKTWGVFGGPRAYSRWVQPAAAIPPRPQDALGGAAFLASIDALTPTEREARIAQEIRRGNLPDFLRQWVRITAHLTDADGHAHTAVSSVMPDYLAVGSDTDFVRIPMTPMTAQRIADAFGVSLPTRKMVDDIYAQATVKLEPLPLTEAREAPATFMQHNTLIEAQRKGHVPGALIAGIKKDIVVTNRLGEKPNRVAIYGWHKLDGSPIQPLTIVHRDTYVDYSHGIRLIRRTILIDGKPRDLHAVLHDPVLSALFSDEGPITNPAY